jgi:hypothetical protein
MAEVAWRYATAADVRSFYGESVKPTLRAVALLVDGAPAAIVGLASEGPYQKLFSDERPEFEPHRRSMAVLRAIKRVQDWIRACPQVVFSESQNRPLLERLGFQQIEEGIFVWPTCS